MVSVLRWPTSAAVQLPSAVRCVEGRDALATRPRTMPAPCRLLCSSPLVTLMWPLEVGVLQGGWVEQQQQQQQQQQQHASSSSSSSRRRARGPQLRARGLQCASGVLLHSDCFCSQHETSSKRGGSRHWDSHLRPIRTLKCILLGQIRHPNDPPPAGPTALASPGGGLVVGGVVGR